LFVNPGAETRVEPFMCLAQLIPNALNVNEGLVLERLLATPID
jgi:hypothetical protein